MNAIQRGIESVDHEMEQNWALLNDVVWISKGREDPRNYWMILAINMQKNLRAQTIQSYSPKHVKPTWELWNKHDDKSTFIVRKIKGLMIKNHH